MFGMNSSVFASGAPLNADSVIFQTFYWDVPEGGTWYDTIRENAPALKAAGFSHFWFPPPTKGAGGGYSMGYDLYDNYDLGQYYQKGTTETRFGSLAELQAAAAACENVILDLVANHMVGAEQQSRDSGDHPWYWQGFQYVHDRFWKSSMDFHPDHPDNCDLCDGNDYILGEDVCHNSRYMFDGQLEWARWMKDTVGNVSGFRLDAAKHFSWNMSKAFGDVADCIGEFWDSKGRIAEWMWHTGNYAYDFPLYYSLQGNASDLDGAGLISNHGISFIANHDTDYISQKHRAYGFILYITPIPSVFWHDWFNPDLKPSIRRALKARNANDFNGTTTVHKTADFIVFKNNSGTYACFNSSWDYASVNIYAAPYTLYTPIAWGPGDKPADVRADANGYVILTSPGAGYCYWKRATESFKSEYLTLHVPGNDENIFGKEWYFDQSNRMQLIEDFTWQWIANIGESASVEYKFAMNSTWDINRGLGNSSGATLPQNNWNLAPFGANISANLPKGVCVWQYNEQTGTSTLFTPDFNHDGTIDISDLAEIANHWNQNCTGPDWCNSTDIDKSSTTDMNDLTRFTEFWLTEVE